jgi:prevent-host-death family protein
MPTIKPISDLRNHFTEISQLVHERDEPVFLTKNGTGDMVIMSIEHYEANIARSELYRKLEEAENEIASGAKGKTPASVKTKLGKLIRA